MIDRLARLSQRRAWALLALVLAAGLAWWQPWRTQSGAEPAPSPTIVRSSATATVASIPSRSDLPTLPPVAVAPTPARGTTPAPSVDPALRKAGSLLYLGRVGSVPGIVTVNADGSAQRLLVPGVYTALAWAPDGARFAAFGGPGYEQIAIFAADGRPLARHAIAPGTECELRWSPDARFLTCVPTYPFRGRERTTILIVDEAGLREALVPPVVRTTFLGWPDPGVLGLVALPEEWPYAAAEVWLVSLADGDVRRMFQGELSPLGWSANGSSLLALGLRQARGGVVQPGEPVFTQLVAINASTRVQAGLERADQLARTATGTAPGRYWFASGSLSPTGQQLALWIAYEAAVGTPGPSRAPDLTLVLLDLHAQGAPIAIRTTRGDGGAGIALGWSPNGRYLALPRFGPQPGESSIEIIGGDRTTARFPLDGREQTTLAWSSDSRWFAYNAPNGLVVASVDGATVVLLDPEGRVAAWRPGGR